MPKLPKQSSMGVGAVPFARKLSLLQDDKVHYFLQPIGVVIADTLVHARHAAELVKVRYNEGKPTMGLIEHLDTAFTPDGDQREREKARRHGGGRPGDRRAELPRPNGWSLPTRRPPRTTIRWSRTRPSPRGTTTG